MNEASWLECTDPQQLLFRLHFWPLQPPRKYRLFASACCRLNWKLLVDERNQRAVEVAERFSDDRAGDEEVKEAYGEALQSLARFGYRSGRGRMAMATFQLLTPVSTITAKTGRIVEACRSATGAGRREAMILDQCHLIRDVFGNPYRTVPFQDSWMIPAVLELAHSIYGQRNFDLMSDLGDALERAGCDSLEVLDHCRKPGLHARGCWVLDGLLRS